MHLHGSLGSSDETPLANMWANIPELGVVDGPTEVHKVAVAKAVLRNYSAHDALFELSHRLSEQKHWKNMVIFAKLGARQGRTNERWRSLIFCLSEQKSGGCSMNESSLSGLARVHTKWAAILFLVAAISPLSWAATDTGERLYGEHCASCHAATLRLSSWRRPLRSSIY